MATLLTRKLKDTLQARLEARAQQHGFSLEDEVPEILRVAPARDTSTQRPVNLMRILEGIFGCD